MSPGTYAAITLLALVCTTGCNHSHQSTQAGGSPVAPSMPAPAPSGPVHSPSTIIPVNTTRSGTLTEDLPECTFRTVDGNFGGLCQIFELIPPSSGLLTLMLRWSADNPLNLFLKTGAGEQIDMTCCNATGIYLEMPVEMGARYRIEVAYGGRPPGYPRIAPVDYTLYTSLDVGNAGAPGTVTAMIFADVLRTHIATAKLEVTDGPSAGAVASFDPSTGIYEIQGLPPGFVQVTASADGFGSVTRRVTVGVKGPQEFDLPRLTSPQQATNLLWGWVSLVSSVCGCVKVEILDGPKAGTVRFSDPDDGWYTISDIPSGLIHVRASAPTLQSQTLSVVVRGDTELDFDLKHN